MDDLDGRCMDDVDGRRMDDLDGRRMAGLMDDVWMTVVCRPLISFPDECASLEPKTF